MQVVADGQGYAGLPLAVRRSTLIILIVRAPGGRVG